MHLESYPHLELQPTQSDLDINYCQKLNYPEWGKPLTLEGYLERERINYNHELCNYKRNWNDDSYGVVYWVLRDTTIIDVDDDDNESNIVCACETLLRPSLFIDGSSGSGTLKDCISGCLGSVFTIPKYRSKGYASKMLGALPIALKTHGFVDNLNFLTLYSEIG
ncbi:hypothetical protein CANARDRAFT_27412, partial [[Candida] arabinofermentans NRRL YB-2248]